MENIGKVSTYTIEMFGHMITINPIPIVMTWLVMGLLVAACLFFGKNFKLIPGTQQSILEMIYELEVTLFNHNLNMLDEKHSEYDQWLSTNKEIQAEIMRLRFIYEKMGGAWENIQEEEYDERGEQV